jgi:hypothetical protein
VIRPSFLSAGPSLWLLGPRVFARVNIHCSQLFIHCAGPNLACRGWILGAGRIPFEGDRIYLLLRLSLLTRAESTHCWPSFFSCGPNFSWLVVSLVAGLKCGVEGRVSSLWGRSSWWQQGYTILTEVIFCVWGSYHIYWGRSEPLGCPAHVTAQRGTSLM